MIPQSRGSPSCTLGHLSRLPKRLLPPLVLLAGVLLPRVARADEPGVPAALMEELAKEAPAQVEVFRRAAKAERDKPQRRLALSLFADIGRATKRFSEASRRACELALEVDTPAVARPHCETAVARARLGTNLVSLALVHATPVAGVPGDAAKARALLDEALSLPRANWWTQADVCMVEGFLDVPRALERASRIPLSEAGVRRVALENVVLTTYRARDVAGAELVARELEVLVPDLSGPWRNAAIFGLERHDAAAVHRAARGLGRLRPPARDAGYYDALAYEKEAKIAAARASFREAERAGHASDGMEALRRRLASQPLPEWARIGSLLAALVAGWVLFVAFFAARACAASGELMTTIAHGRPLPQNTDLGDDVRARRDAYRRSLSALLSLLVPVRFAFGLTLTAAAFVGVPLLAPFLIATRAPWDPWALGGAAALIALVIKTPAPPPSRGVAIALAEHPALAAMLDDIGEAAGFRPVRGILLVQGARLRLLHGGSLWQLARGRGQPRLELGLETLRSLDVQAFRAMLVQTLSSLATEELPGATLALAARARLQEQLTRRGPWWSPNLARPFVRLAERLFRRASLAAARYQELRGDALAVALCGALPFERGLRALTPEPAVGSTPAPEASAPTYRSTPETTASDPLPWDQGGPPYDAAPSVAERLWRAGATPRREGREDVDEEASRPAWRLFSRRKELKATVLGS